MHHRHEEAQPGRPDGPLEREPLEDSHVRLAGPGRRRLRHWRHGRHEEPQPEHVRSGRVGPDGQDPRRRVQAPRGGKRVHPEPHPPGRHARVRRGRAGRRRPHLAGARSSAQIEPPKVSKDGHAVLVDFRIARPEGQGAGQGPAGRRRGRGGAGSPSGLLRRRDGRRERPEGRRGHLWQGSGQGRDAFAPDHAPDPARHVRGARRSGDPAAVRAHRRVRHVRAHRNPEPRPPDAERGPGARAPGRARGRRRLHDVLPPPRT